MRTNVATLPEIIVRAVAHNLFPESHVPFEVRGVGIRQRPHALEKGVTIWRFVVELVFELLGWLRTRPTEGGHEVEGVRQDEGAIVVPVVADEPISTRRLRR